MARARLGLGVQLLLRLGLGLCFVIDGDKCYDTKIQLIGLNIFLDGESSNSIVFRMAIKCYFFKGII
jgi:hypothetical protein